MIKEFYAIQKFQKIIEVLDLDSDLELLELKRKTGILHIITRINIISGEYKILKSFKDFDGIELFLSNFKFKIKTLLEEDVKKILEKSSDYIPTPTKKRPLASNLKK